MRWLREKQYIMILGIVSLLIIAYIIITDEGDISYEPITVKKGTPFGRWRTAISERWTGRHGSAMLSPKTILKAKGSSLDKL